MLEFESPRLLTLLVLLLPLGWRALRSSRYPGAALQFSDLRVFATVPTGLGVRWRRVLPLARLLALALLIVALARPRFGTVERDVIAQGVDMFYCLDISGSMRAEDFAPNRMEKAKELTAEFAAKRGSDRQGVVLFAGVAFTLCPLTFDAEAVIEFLRHVTFDELGIQNTAIGMGLSRALKKLQSSKAKSKVIILMTDGENNAGQIDPLQATRVAKAMGVRVYAIGIGSRGIAWVTVNTPFGLQRQRIQTSIDEDLLTRIARETGGIYRRASDAGELQAIFREIDKLEKTKIEMKEYRSYDERMALAAWPALGLLLLELMLAGTRFLKIP